MLLPSVSETLASVSRHPALEAAISTLRRGVAHEHVSGLTDTAKALVAAHVAAELRRPVVVLTTSGARAETLAASLEFFYKALAGQEATEVAVFPALDAFPWQEVSSHAEILETRAVTLWRYTSGLARVVVAPIAAARMRLADAASYAAQARSLARDQEVSLEEFVTHLRRVGYESHDMVEMPGQFTVRGGIVDVFPAEAERPVRLELFGDAVESLRSRLAGIRFDLRREGRAFEFERLQLGVDSLVEFFRRFGPRGGELCRGRAVTLAGLGGGRLQLFQLLGAGIDQRHVGGVFRGQCRQSIDRRRIFARGGAQREQPFLDAFKL